MSIEDLPNIGPALAARLSDIGITEPDQLREAGSVACVLRLHDVHDPACYNTLYALEGAIRGIRWHDIPTADRDVLKARLKDEDSASA